MKSRCVQKVNDRGAPYSIYMQTTLYKWGGTAKAFCDCPDEIDVALVADALVTIFRFLPESESVPILMQALRPEQSDAVKISAIKACITLITDVSCA